MGIFCGWLCQSFINSDYGPYYVARDIQGNAFFYRNMVNLSKSENMYGYLGETGINVYKKFFQTKLSPTVQFRTWSKYLLKMYIMFWNFAAFSN